MNSADPVQASTCPLCGGNSHHDYSGRDLMLGGETVYHYHRCEGCGLVYQYPLPDAATIASFYPPTYGVHQAPKRTAFNAREIMTLRAKLGYSHLPAPRMTLKLRLRGGKAAPLVPHWQPGGRVLDVGCGNGEYLLRLQAIGWRCQGVELSENAADVGRSLGLDVFCGDLTAAGFPDDSFDVVTAHHLIEHTTDPQALLAEIARVTRPGGTVMIRTPDATALGRRWLGVYWFANDIPRHLYLFSPQNLRQLAEHCGLQVTEMRRPVKPKLLLRSLVLRNGGAMESAPRGLKASVVGAVYRLLATLAGSGDELFMVCRKPARDVAGGYR